MSEETSHVTVEEQLRNDLKEATRQRDQVRMDTIRMALTAFRNEEVARSRQPLSEQDRFALLDKQIKQRQESAQIFRTGNRPELADKEEREARILAAYLPARLTDDEIRAVVARLIEAHGKEFRAVMPLASKETKGRADGKRVSEIVREMTA
ncbi:MAG TPA: GatB/YqeY domain-containing protein [Ktedonobacterales bacterium]|nr:GatB/YqeY domain-containing protein [Ktedonobacterales bacterium]